MQGKSLFTLGFLFLVLSSGAFAAPSGLSSRRSSQETYEQASSRVREGRPKINVLGNDQDAEAVQGPLEEINISGIPELASIDELNARFAFVRDTQFINVGKKTFPRRLSWLYPDDGCYARAELTAQFLKENGAKSPKKIFAFGNLRAKTNNTRSGNVHWWYHVAAIYRVGETPYVFDPALQSEAPMTLADWNQAIGGSRSEVSYSLCSAHTLDPEFPCNESQELSRSSALSLQLPFLDDEWERLEELNRDPYKELGDSPPWKH